MSLSGVGAKLDHPEPSKFQDLLLQAIKGTIPGVSCCSKSYRLQEKKNKKHHVSNKSEPTLSTAAGSAQGSGNKQERSQQLDPFSFGTRKGASKPLRIARLLPTGQRKAKKHAKLGNVIRTIHTSSTASVNEDTHTCDNWKSASATTNNHK
eukprot:m.22566 g.22566  ORF g.22566 m.22566 type:complete len:151 (-) comp12740_c0_seq1:78-530(-)